MRFAGLGVEFAAAVAGLTLLGYWIDRRYDSEPWGLLIGAGIGLVGGMYNMLREALSAVEPQGAEKSSSDRKLEEAPSQEAGRAERSEKQR